MTRWRELFWLGARVFVGFIFAYAGLAKLLEPVGNFEAAITKYGVIPPTYIPIVARIVPWFEWVSGSFLLVGYAPRLSAALTALLSLGFMVILGSSPLFLEAGGTDCGCFGASGLKLSINQMFGVDLVSFIVSLRLLARKNLPWTLDFLLKQKETRDDIKKTEYKGEKGHPMKRYLFTILLVFLVGAASAWAAGDAATKFSRGLQNTLFGWFEITNEIGNASDRHGFWIGFPEGLLRGTVFGILRTGAGVFEVISFPFPNGKKGYNAIVLPESAFGRR